MTPALPLALLPVLTLAATLPDRGIFPDLDDKARIAAPTWEVAPGERPWLRLDQTHGLLTAYRGTAALTAWRLSGPVPIDERRSASLRATDDLPSAHALARHLAPADAAELRRLLPADAPVVAAPPPRAEDHDGDGLSDSLDILRGAKKLVENKAAYREEYRALPYPGGDVPRTEGVCTDTLIRALRNAGWDLQREVHEDILRRPRAYHLEKAPDANIDHRRIRNLVPWFQTRFVAVPADAPLRPGDIVLLDTFPRKSGPDHAGIVSDRLGPSGKPLIINNWTDGFVEQEMDLLPVVPVTHRFRPPPPQPPAR